MSQSHLKKIINELKNIQDIDSLPVAVFDLDSTLFDVSHRIARILNDFGHKPEIVSQHREKSDILKLVKSHPHDFGVRRTLERYQFPFDDKSFMIQLIEFWKNKFFSNDYHNSSQTRLFLKGTPIAYRLTPTYSPSMPYVPDFPRTTPPA